MAASKYFTAAGIPKVKTGSSRAPKYQSLKKAVQKSVKIPARKKYSASKVIKLRKVPKPIKVAKLKLLKAKVKKVPKHF